jgi:hypothetical protein
MNYARVLMASVGAMVAYFAFGGIFFAVFGTEEFEKYPQVYRPKAEIMKAMPYGMVAIFVAIVVAAFIYANGYQGGSGLVEGARFGALVGIFSVCTFVIHNWVNLNIGWKITLQQAVSYFVQWVLVGVVIGLIYRPVAGK